MVAADRKWLSTPSYSWLFDNRLHPRQPHTNKTRSWDGGIKSNLGGAIVIRDESGFGMDRDVNGARGIFLRALEDSPFLRGLLTQVASQQTNASSIVC